MAPAGQQASGQLVAGVLEARAGTWDCGSGFWVPIAIPILSSRSRKLERQFDSRMRSQAQVSAPRTHHRPT